MGAPDSMTGRQRLLNILDGQPIDRLAWTTLVDDVTRSIMSAEVRQMPLLEFYRHIGCDTFLFGSYGLPGELQVTHPCRRVVPGMEVQWRQQGETDICESRASWGVLTFAACRGHPVKYPVENAEDLRILRESWEKAAYEELPGTEASYARLAQALGEDGIFAALVGPSPVQQLIEYDMGLERFYYLLQDCPEAMRGLLDAMHSRRMQEYEICARRYPCRVVIPVENTSSSLTSPEVYRQFTLPQMVDFVEVMHRHGKLAVPHMCGRLKALLPAIRETRADGLNALTPPPVGDCPWEQAMDLFGDDALILGGIFNVAAFQKPGATEQEIRAEMERTYTPRVRRARLLTWFAADGLPTPLERFLTVRDWVDRRGAL